MELATKPASDSNTTGSLPVQILVESQPLVNVLKNSAVSSSVQDRWIGYRDVLATLIVCLGAMSMGLVVGYSNPALQDQDLLRLLDSIERQTWFGSLVAIGAIFGGPCAGFLVAHCGRKTTLVLCTVPMGVGWFITVCGVSFVLLFIGRVATGFGMGMVALAVPLYIAEVASKDRRGILGTGFQLFVSLGILLVYGIGIPLSWNWLAVTCLGVSSLNILLLLVIPESPRWCLMKKRRLEALESLAWLADSGAKIEEEYMEMEKSLGTQPMGGMSLREFGNPAVFKPMLISFGMMFFQQLSGINAVIFYSSAIFAVAGYADDPRLPTIIIGAVLFASTVVACLLMDRVGRRILLLVSGILMTVSLTALGVSFYLRESYNVDNINWLSLGSVLLFVVFFSLGWGPIPWLIISEIVSTRARGVVIGMATCFAWVLLFLTTKEFERLRSLLNSYGAFWFFAGFCLLSCFFVGIFVPETKGRSLEEIQDDFSGFPRAD